MKKVHITQVQRYEIAAYLRAGFSQAEIARLLNKSRSVICREINLNKNSRGHYSGGDLYRCLPHSLKHRRRPVNKPMPFADRVSIDERPSVVDQRCHFGDWEMDTIVGKNGKGGIVTLVERTSKKLLMARSPKYKGSRTVAQLVVQMLMPFSNHVLSITTTTIPSSPTTNTS